MKKIFYTIIAAAGIFTASSCSDMIETDSTNFVAEPSLDEKSDSVFFAFGIMQAMQGLADQYFLQNELRGDLVKTTSLATTDLKNLASFNAGAENKYDSVYQYYNVINNCNYYLDKRAAKLTTDTTSTIRKEYAGVAAFRAWTYLQLTSQYGDVPYVTDPVLTKTDINANTATTDYRSILQQQADYLQNLKDSWADPSQLLPPTYDRAMKDHIYDYEFGRTNWSSTKRGIATQKCFIPFNIVLGDLYLELQQYDKAIYAYYDYLENLVETRRAELADLLVNELDPKSYYSNNFTWEGNYDLESSNQDKDGSNKWSSIFLDNMGRGMLNSSILSYIPMAVNFTQGKTSDVPAVFGYDFYASSTTGRYIYSDDAISGNCPQKKDVMVIPSDDYKTLATQSPYYYWTREESTLIKGDKVIDGTSHKGDARANSVIGDNLTEGYENMIYVGKPGTGYFYLYRSTSVYMRIAECFNRMGYPEIAFAILKCGLNTTMNDYTPSKYDTYQNSPGPGNGYPGYPRDNYFLPQEYYSKLVNGEGMPPFLSDMMSELLNFNNIKGVHQHGAGSLAVSHIGSPYTYKAVVEKKIDEIRAQFGVGSGSYTKNEYINAMEDLLCDEYALEFAFEGRRFSDLLRLARHKNASSPYGAGFGDLWLSKKLENKKPGITTKNCYLPFK